MTAAGFRRIARGLSGVVEGVHMGHPDFRVNGRIFATLQTADRGMVALTPDEQARFTAEHPEVFVTESGAWGRQGYTRVYLKAADPEVVGEAMTLAWQRLRDEPVRRATRPRR
jgi:hypothetical protein